MVEFFYYIIKLEIKFTKKFEFNVKTAKIIRVTSIKLILNYF